MAQNNATNNMNLINENEMNNLRLDIQNLRVIF